MKYILNINFLKKNILINLTIFVFSFYVSLLLIEIFIHYYLDKKQIQNNFPTIYQYLQNKDLTKYQPYNLPQEIVINEKKFFSLGSISSKKIALCNENNYMSTFLSDQYGFNNQNYDWDKDIYHENIVLIGDSFVLGACVEQDKNIGSLIKKKQIRRF